MAKAPPPFAPAALTANDVRSGAVLFRTESGWTLHFAEATLAWDAATLARLQEAANVDLASGAIVDLNVVLIEGSADAPRLKELRERIRASGPTIAYAS